VDFDIMAILNSINIQIQLNMITINVMKVWWYKFGKSSKKFVNGNLKYFIVSPYTGIGKLKLLVNSLV